MRSVVILLKFRVHLDNPRHALRDVWRDDGGGERTVGMGRVRVTDVMEKGSDDILGGPAIVEGAGRRLQ